MCTSEYIDFVCSQLKGAGDIIMKKQMSDDWCIYINDKPIILAFDNLVLDIEHRDKAMKVVHALLAS